MTVGNVRAASQELGDGGELVTIEILQQRGHISSYGIERVMDVSHPLERWVEDLLTPVVRVRFTAQVSGPHQPRHHTSDRATGQVSNRGQVAAGHGPALAQQVEALVIRWTQTQALRDRVVKQHRRNAVSAHQPSDDLFGQLTLPLGCSSVRRRSHGGDNSLLDKLFTK